MPTTRGLILVLTLAAVLAAEEPAAAEARILDGIRSGRMAVGGSIDKLAELGDEAYVAALPALLAILESRPADALAGNRLLITLARVDIELPAPLMARVKAWTGGVSDDGFLTLLEANQRAMIDQRKEDEQTAKSKATAGQDSTGATPPTPAVEPGR